MIIFFFVSIHKYNVQSQSYYIFSQVLLFIQQKFIQVPLPFGEVLLALLGDFMLCAMRLILALTASEERKAGLGLTSGRGIIEPGEVFLGVGDGAAVAALSVGCGEAANFSRRLPNWSSCSRAAGEPLILLTDSE